MDEMDADDKNDFNLTEEDVTSCEEGASPSSVDSYTNCTCDSLSDYGEVKCVRYVNHHNHHRQQHRQHQQSVSPSSTTSSSSASGSPIYANLPLIGSNNDNNNGLSPSSTTTSSPSPTVSSSPPIPETGADPNRVLLNHWSEYIHLSGRKYYYNSVTKQSSWKPPRRGLPIFRDEEENTSHSEENLTDGSSANSWSPTSNSRELTSSISSDISSQTIYSHRLKPRVRSRKTILDNLWQLNINTTASDHHHRGSGHHDTWTTPLPPGWTRYINEKQVYFVNDATKVKWFCKLDDTGRLYFYEENGEKSYWHLPEAVTDEESDRDWQSQSDVSESYSPTTKEPASEQSSTPSSATIAVNKIKSDGSLRIPMRKHSNNNGLLSPIDRSFKAKSMVFLPTDDRFVDIDLDTEDKLFPIKSSKPPIPENLEASKAFKTGLLNRTKIMENGKRLRKNWCTSLVALTDHYLLICKDAKNNANQEENIKPEMAIELGGSLIEWSQGLSSRKNVFQLTTFTGNIILLQEDCSLTAAEWFYSIKSAISKLPKCDGTNTIGSNTLESNRECKLKRSKSTKQTFKKPEITPKLSPKNGGTEAKITPEKKRKISERLINFLRRRPTLDSLREKGIFKDGPVFGCDLYSLCHREKQLVPKVVQQCIKAIEQKGLKADGIYRVCGNLSEVQKIRYQVNHDNYDGIWAQEDVHVLTGALKLFFRDMKEPLFPCNRFDSLMFSIGLPDRKKKQEAIVRVIRDLPKCNKETLKFLLKHLLRIQDHKDENRMHLQNLAIVFGPTLMWPETDSNNLAYDMMLKMHSNQVIELCLQEFENIFK